MSIDRNWGDYPTFLLWQQKFRRKRQSRRQYIGGIAEVLQSENAKKKGKQDE